MTTHNEAAIERSVRAGCDAVDPHLRCSFPECGCKTNPRIVRAALAALLAEHDRRVSELLAANTAEVEHRRVAEDEREEAREVVRALTAHNVATSAERDAVAALAERMWPIVDAVCREWLNGSRDTLADDERYFAAHLRHRVGRAAAALVREREETRL